MTTETSDFLHRMPWRLVLLIGAVLTLLAAWPLFFLKYLPHQDLPAHLASAYIVDHLADFPEYVATSGISSNAMLSWFLRFIARSVGYVAAGRLYVLIVLATTAFGYVYLLLQSGGSRKAMLGGFLLLPFVNHWFISVGMLNFALSFGLCLWIFALQVQQRVAWSNARAAIMVALSMLAWFAHSFALLLLVFVSLLDFIVAWFRKSSDRIAAWRAALPVIPGAIVVGLGALLQPVHVFSSTLNRPYVIYDSFGAQLVGLVRYYVHGAGPWALFCVVPAVLLSYWLIRRTLGDSRLLTWPTLGVLAVTYLFLPAAILPTWAFLNARLLPFLWLGLLVRIPERVAPRLLTGLLVASLGYSVGNGVTLLRMDRELSEFGSGMGHVAKNARMLPLLFSVGNAGDNIDPVLHADAYYTLERGIHTGTVWASRNVDMVQYRKPPSLRFHHEALQSRPRAMASAEKWCSRMVRGTSTVLEDCPRAWLTEWQSFLVEAKRDYDAILLWNAPAPIVDLVRAHYEDVHRNGRLILLRRKNPN